MATGGEQNFTFNQQFEFIDDFYALKKKYEKENNVNVILTVKNSHTHKNEALKKQFLYERVTYMQGWRNAC